MPVCGGRVAGKTAVGGLSPVPCARSGEKPALVASLVDEHAGAALCIVTPCILLWRLRPRTELRAGRGGAARSWVLVVAGGAAWCGRERGEAGLGGGAASFVFWKGR